MILSDRDLLELIAKGLVIPFSESFLNPASIDVRVGNRMIREHSYGGWGVPEPIPDEGVEVGPNEFLLVDTLERFCVPNGYAMDLRLKSSTARKGWDHNSALWVDPGWKGVLTMELKNQLQYNSLRLTPGQRFAQVLVHKLSSESARPYAGRYQGAGEVQAAKD